MNFSEKINEKISLLNVNGILIGRCPKCGMNTFCVDNKSEQFYCASCDIQGGYEEFTYLIGYSLEEPAVTITEFAVQVFKANLELQKYFIEHLKEDKIQSYIQSRKISSTVISSFCLGFAPKYNQKITNHLMQRYSKEVLLATGIFKDSDTGIYLLMRERLIIPIKDMFGNIIAWSGRKIDDSDTPKYINSPESEIFHKKDILFGFDTAKESLQDGVIVCEGYMDVAAMQTAGYKNTVASMGTALTKEQLKLLRYHTDTLYLCYDNDDAGHEATLRAIKNAKVYNFKIYVIQMSDYKDPDEYISHDPKLIQTLIDNAIPENEFLRQVYMEQDNISALIDLLLSEI